MRDELDALSFAFAAATSNCGNSINRELLPALLKDRRNGWP
jgi:hypothetical protein